MKNESQSHKIDVIVKYFHPVTAGIETNIRETYSVLVKKGWKVNIHTTKDTYLEKNSLPRFEIFKGLNVYRYKFFGDYIGYFPKIDLSKSSVVAFHNFNVYYFWMLLYLMIAKLIFNKKIVVIITPHGGFNPEWKVFSKFQAIFKETYHKTLGAYLINHVANGVRAVSDWEKAEMIKVGLVPEKISVIVNGLEDEAYMDVDKLASSDIRNKVKNWGKYIIQIGRVYPIKNYETVIKSMAKIDKNINFVIAGPIEKNQFPKYFDDLNKLIKKLKLEDRVIFAGVITGIDKYYLIKHSLMMVHMAIWESFCNVVHEGLSQGKVCIVANNTALPYLVKDSINGYCVDTFDANGLANKINYVVKNMQNKVIRDMQEKNKNIGANESWTSVAAKMDSWYTELSK